MCIENLCKTCLKTCCKKRIIKIDQQDLKIIKCLDYKKDQEKVKGYVKQVNRTAKFQRTLMGLYSSDWG